MKEIYKDDIKGFLVVLMIPLYLRFNIIIGIWQEKHNILKQILVLIN
jgi:hypothetical protein